MLDRYALPSVIYKYTAVWIGGGLGLSLEGGSICRFHNELWRGGRWSHSTVVVSDGGCYVCLRKPLEPVVVGDLDETSGTSATCFSRDSRGGKTSQ